jgi:hypothetical protein
METKETNPVLKGKKLPDMILKFKTDFEEAQKGTSVVGLIKSIINKNSTKLTAKAAELGLLLINEFPEYKADNYHYGSIIKPVSYKDKRYNRIETLLGEKEWNDQENYNLLIYFFGEEKAAWARDGWKNVRYEMYQTGYSRRSFRSPGNREKYFINQVNFIIQLIPQTYSTSYEGGFKTHYYDLSITEQVKYDHISCNENAVLFKLWSAAIDSGNTAVFQQMEDIFFDRDTEGKVTRNIIKGLLNSNKKQAWELVEKLLLAAQRQEGLRQTILEALDETSVGALKYMIGVIVEHQLARFSSVVRAVDVWAGFGWESERETTVRSFLEKAKQYLDNPETIPQGVQSENNADVYMALWAQGVYDVEQTIPFLTDLSNSPQPQKRTLALLFANQTEHYKIGMPFYYKALDDEQIEPLACAVKFVSQAVGIGSNNQHYDKYYPGLFDKLNGLYSRITVKEKTIESFVFSWTKIQFEKKSILKAMASLVLDKQDRLNIMLSYFDDMDAEIRGRLSSIILPVHSSYSYKRDEKKKTELTAFQRAYALLILKDRSEYNTAHKALYDVTFTDEEMQVFPDLLKRKAAEFRSKIIELVLKQQDALISPVLEQLIVQGDPEQRLAALDILIQLRNSKRLADKSKMLITTFQERKSISPKEEILLSQLTGEADVQDVTEENGYGIYDPKNLSAIVDPHIDPSNIYEKQRAIDKYCFSMPYSKIKEAFTDLYNIYQQHKTFEYEAENWDDSVQKILLGNEFRKKWRKAEYQSREEEYQDYPLPHIWKEWYNKHKLQPVDLFIVVLSLSNSPNAHWETKPFDNMLPNREELIPSGFLQMNYRNPAAGICNALRLIHPFDFVNEFCIGACNRLFSSFDKNILHFKWDERHYGSNLGWQSVGTLNVYLDPLKLESLTEEQIKKCWQLYNWRQHSGLEQYKKENMPPFLLFCRAFSIEYISKDEMLRGMMTPENIRILSTKTIHKNDFNYFELFPFLVPLYEKMRSQLLNVELKRGDSPTAITRQATALQMIQGIDRLAEILAGLGKTSLNKGYIYGYGVNPMTKQESFSTLIKRCFPAADDTQALFEEKMQKIKVSEQRLIEVAMYAPQWQSFISEYLGWKGLDTAIWWMHAHTKTDAYHAQNAEAESEISKYSTLDVQEFKDGAVDKEWFTKAYKAIGNERWGILYDAAKYISDGNGHRRARIYADVLLGNLQLKEVVDKITTKRDQDFLRIYGLAPLSKTKSEKDILERYEYIQAFKKESKQFGAQKQASEAAAVRVSMENLSRNAGYPDPIRFTWAMETKQIQAIFSKETQVQYEDILIGLVIDEDGMADVVAFKDDKQLKAIPAKYKKDKKVEELQGFRKTLREQFRRSLRGLEDAMVRGDAFKLSEIKTLFTHPIICKHLEHIVFVAEQKDGKMNLGFYRDNNLVNANGEMYEPTAADSLRIAHCVDLYESSEWSAYQHLMFEKKIKQPFKQIFREFYTPTADELNEKTISRRYAGHQVQPKQTVALLRTRGWKVNYEEGLQKVFHKEGFVARLYAMADWFSPADVENPTLEVIKFESLKDFKPVAFSSISKQIFSEVMRDVDLVVSVAHAGGVDAEASHSTIEMRSVLIKETMRLFKINNAEVNGSHVTIKGTLGDYSVHIGSAVVHKIAGSYLSILPVHSQQRGRIFLPFADDDPKSAEVISKILLLARDNEIKDPTILEQLN